ncbi:MAG TPA: CO2 hydration protein [Prochlorococcaceae cyanobacterium AMR_MDS_5431]|nr:CO2 hydration protein [Prochlorococcaceae cyanobacterium AMR_MDS_5431]
MSETISKLLLKGETLLQDSPDHLLQVIGVLESYGEVLDAYSINLIDQGQRQFLNPFPIFRFCNGQISFNRLYRHLLGDRINFEYAEYCQKAMFWHSTGGLDVYFNSDEFLSICKDVIEYKSQEDILIKLLNPMFKEFLPELIRSSATTHLLGVFWRVMSDLFVDLGRKYRDGSINNIKEVVAFIRNGLVAAAGKTVSYRVEISGRSFDILPATANLNFLVDVAVPYVEAVFLRGMPFLGTVSFNAQAQQISPDQGQFKYGALYADPLPTMGAGIPPSLLMQDMYRHLPQDLYDWYKYHGRGEADMKLQICISFQKAMFCVTNGAIAGTFPYPLSTTVQEEQTANQAYAKAWAGRLAEARVDTLPNLKGREFNSLRLA